MLSRCSFKRHVVKYQLNILVLVNITVCILHKLNSTLCQPRAAKCNNKRVYYVHSKNIKLCISHAVRNICTAGGMEYHTMVRLTGAVKYHTITELHTVYITQLMPGAVKYHTVYVYLIQPNITTAPSIDN